MKRNNKYLIWANIFMLLIIPEAIAGGTISGNSPSTKYIGLGIVLLAIPSFILFFVFYKLDTKLNAEFDKEQNIDEWLEYKRLKDKYENKNGVN